MHAGRVVRVTVGDIGAAIGRVRLRHRGLLAPAGWALACIGFLSFGVALWRVVERDGGVAVDFQAYWLAARNLLEGRPLYGPVEIGDPGAYRYPPTFALLAVPFAALPEPVAAWLYRLVCLLLVRYLVGSWMAVGWALLFVPLQIELIALNVTLPIAAAARLALRGPSPGLGAALVPATAALKYGTTLLIPYLWWTRRDLRRPMLLGVLGLVGACVVHAVVDPGAGLPAASRWSISPRRSTTRRGWASSCSSCCPRPSATSSFG